jgi:putative autotransporter adhesin-like protein
VSTAEAPDRPRGSQRAWVAGLTLVAAVGIALALAVRYDVFGGSSRARIEGSGVAATQTRALPAFHGIELAGSNTVTVSVGGPQSVVVIADDNLLDRVTTRVKDGRLIIGTAPGSFTTRRSMSVDISVPWLDSLELSGSGAVTVAGLRGSRMTMALSGSGIVRASGAVGRLDVRLGGSGEVELAALRARNVHAVAAGSGQILVTAKDTLDASVPGTGAIIYRGNPRHVRTSVTGNGIVGRG